MARQVAHEIKNPLTPMKLSIQYLQKAIDNDTADVRALSSRVARTLIEQIEHLSRIAAEFSEFANIGNPRNVDFDIHEVLRSLLSLHGMNEKVDITMHLSEGPVMVHADRTQLNRLFTNLLLNAIESIPEDRPGVIRVSERIVDGEVEVRVTDNGMGIAEEMRSRIFTPNFTTKSSGTGLGLAMSKGIVEQAKGSIRFETSSGSGTTFFVRLPLAGATETPES
jgi:nitrogen fixation/metabolism regulation signal transduction histidine kinase